MQFATKYTVSGVVLLLIISTQVWAQKPLYEVRVLEPAEAYGWAYGVDINNSGQVSGTIEENGGLRAARWDANSVLTILNPAVMVNVMGFGLDEDGRVAAAGKRGGSQTCEEGVYYTQFGGRRLLPDLPNACGCVAKDVSGSRFVVGHCHTDTTPVGEQTPVYWDTSQPSFITVTALRNLNNSSAGTVNSVVSGIAYGASLDNNDEWNCTQWNLPNPGPVTRSTGFFDYCQAHDGNGRGDVVGESTNILGELRGILLPGPIGRVGTELPPITAYYGSRALGINEASDPRTIVGDSFNPGKDLLATLWTETGGIVTTTDLNDCIDPLLDLTLRTAEDVNDNGEIVANGHYGDDKYSTVAVVLRPVDVLLGSPELDVAEDGQISSSSVAFHVVVQGNPLIDVWVAVGVGEGKTSISGCSEELEIQAVHATETGQTDNQGRVQIDFSLPNQSKGLDLRLQAYTSDCDISNVVEWTP